MLYWFKVAEALSNGMVNRWNHKLLIIPMLVKSCWRIIQWDGKSLKPNRSIYHLTEETCCYAVISKSPVIFCSATPLNLESLQFRTFRGNIALLRDVRIKKHLFNYVPWLLYDCSSSSPKDTWMKMHPCHETGCWKIVYCCSKVS